MSLIGELINCAKVADKVCFLTNVCEQPFFF